MQNGKRERHDEKQDRAYRGEKADSHGDAVMEPNVGQRGRSCWRWSGWLRFRRFLRDARIIVLRFAALVAESRIGRQLRAAGAIIGHDFSLT